MRLKLLYEVTSPYSINWEIPSEEYFEQEFTELLGNPIRFRYAEFFHPQNFELIYALMPKTFEIIAEFYGGEGADVRKTLKGNDVVHDDITGTKSDKRWNELRNILLNNSETREEARNIFRKGKLVDWGKEDVKRTSYMGTLRDLHGGWDPEELGKTKMVSSKVIANLRARDDKYAEGITGNMERLREKRSVSLPPPFILKLPYSETPYILIGGHKRSTAALQMRIPVKVWLIDLTQA